MRQEYAVLILTVGIWLLIGLISFCAARRMKRHRMAVSDQGELIELDEHEDAIAL